MKNYRIIEQTNGHGEKTFYLQEWKRVFLWHEWCWIKETFSSEEDAKNYIKRNTVTTRVIEIME